MNRRERFLTWLVGRIIEYVARELNRGQARVHGWRCRQCGCLNPTSRESCEGCGAIGCVSRYA